MCKRTNQGDKRETDGEDRGGPPKGVCVDMVTWLERQAEEQVASGLMRDGLHSYHKLLQVARTDPVLTERAHIRMAEILLTGGDQYRAATHLREAVQTNSNNAYAVSLLGRIHLDLQECREAAECASTACRLDPGVSDYRQLLGHALLCAGEWSAGCTELDNAIDLDPDNVIAVCDLAVARVQQLRFEDAERLLVDTMDRHPANTLLRDAMGSVQQVRQSVKMRRAAASATFRSGRLDSQPRSLSKGHKLIEDSFKRNGYPKSILAGTLKLFDDAVHIVGIPAGNKSVMAAACQYAVMRLASPGTATQSGLATEYGVSATAISYKYRTMVDRLGITRGDKRYTSAID